MAQHYGVHTPLLDWTYNPLAALYFASEGISDHSGCVYALPTTPFEQYSSYFLIDPFATDQRPLIMVRADGMNTRAVAQRSVMTLHRPPTQNAWSYQVAADEHLGLSIEPFHVAAGTKSYLRAALSILGITKLSLMADIASAVDAFNDGSA